MSFINRIIGKKQKKTVVKSKQTKSSRLTIGRVDKASFPELGLNNIKIKIDTGAFTSSLHVTDIEIARMKDQKALIIDLSEHKNAPKPKLVWAGELSRKKVKSSNGQAETRYAIETTLEIFEKEFPILITLTNRSDMKYPVLLGRQFLGRNKIIVDPNRKNLSFKNQKEP